VYLSPEKPRVFQPPTWRTSLANDPYVHLRDRTYLTQKFDYYPKQDTHKKVRSLQGVPSCLHGACSYICIDPLLPPGWLALAAVWTFADGVMGTAGRRWCTR
jgi:hypothetical protein